MSKLTIPQIRHCLLALANKLEVEPNTTHPSRLEVAGVLRYLAEETRRRSSLRGGGAPRGSRKKGDGSNRPLSRPVESLDPAQKMPPGPTTLLPDMTARQRGQEDGFAGVSDHAARYPAGGPGHGDYVMGLAEGERGRGKLENAAE